VVDTPKVRSGGTVAGIVLALALCCPVVGSSQSVDGVQALGPVSPRIVNGLPTQSFPTTGALLHNPSGPITADNAGISCSGTLIGCRTFLTAAHCVIDGVASHYWVYLQHGGIYTVASVASRPSSTGVSGNDVAIVTLSASVDGIAPTPINSTHDLNAMGVGLAGVIAGFGRTGGTSSEYGIKRYGAIQTADCNPALTGGEGNDKLVCWDFTSPLGSPGQDSNTCNGDSGGPLFMDFGSGSQVVGVTLAGTSATCLVTDHSWDASVYYNKDYIQPYLDADSTTACGELPPVGDPAVTVLASSGTLIAASLGDNLTVNVGGTPSVLRVTLNAKANTSFDPDLYVKQGAGGASPSSYDCKADGLSAFGACEFANPTPGTWSIYVARAAGAGSYQVTTTVFGPAPAAATATPTHTPTVTATVTIVPTPTPTPSPTPTASATSTATATISASPTATSTVTPTRTATATTTPAPTATATPASRVCGNGFQESGEECDDGNLVSGDGCSTTCTLEPCGPGPQTGCRVPAHAKGLLRIKVNALDPGKNRLQWKWGNGAATSKAEFHDPTVAEKYDLCLYDAGALVSSTRIEAGGLCSGKSCWKERAKGFQFRDRQLTPDGAALLLLRAGAGGKAQVQFAGRGATLELPPLAGLTGPIDVQLKQVSGTVCWGATFSAPFTKNNGVILSDKSD